MIKTSEVKGNPKKSLRTKIKGKCNDISCADGNKTQYIAVEPLLENYKNTFIH
jgi:hypothetical protein